MEEKQLTAVEWLAKKLESYGDPQFCKITWEDLDSLVKQAKEMEKQHLYKFYMQGGVDAIMEADRNVEQYYNETFKSE